MPVIDVDLARELVGAQFPQWADLPVMPLVDQGHDNRTFMLGDDLTIRLPSAEQYAAQVVIEHQWLPVIASSRLPLRIPEPVALGQPGSRFPWHWSVRRWLSGETVTSTEEPISVATAEDLAAFLRALQEVPHDGRPRPGPQNFFRGAHPYVYDAETRAAISELRTVIDAERAEAVWSAASASTATGRPRWVHGDMAPSNLLFLKRRLHAVIDFGCMAVGDPACDLAIAWTACDASARDAFFGALRATEDMVARARGWALWKALTTLKEGPEQAERSRVAFGWSWPAREIVATLLEDDIGKT